MGAFGSRDSLLGDTADPATLNRYAYAEGNPVAACDPTGHVVNVNIFSANCTNLPRPVAPTHFCRMHQRTSARIG